MAELLLEELGKGLKAGGVIEKLVKIRRPSSNSTNVLFGGTTSCLFLGIGMLQNIRELRTKAEGEQCQKGTDDTWVSGMMEAESLFLLSLFLPRVPPASFFSSLKDIRSNSRPVTFCLRWRLWCWERPPRQEMLSYSLLSTCTLAL